jgi:hypothetical protein
MTRDEHGKVARSLQRRPPMKSLLLIFVACCALALGCSTNKPAEGPAEKAGASVDEGAHDAKESAKEAGEKVGEATENAGEKLQEKSGD